jgi:Spy/CpxP family protein refolding chaperone
MRTAGISILTVLMFSALAFAAPGQGKQGSAPYHGPGMGQWYDQLSTEQQEALQSIHDKYMDQMRDMRLQLKAKKAALRAQVLGSSPDRGQVDSLVSEINELRSKLFSAKVNMQMEKRAKDLPVHGMHMRDKGMMNGSGCPMMHKKMQGGKMMQGKGMKHGGQGTGQGMMQGQNAPQSAN